MSYLQPPQTSSQFIMSNAPSILVEPEQSSVTSIHEPSCSSTKRKRRDLSNKSEEEKRSERLVANRKAAYNCRLRKRILIEELQRQVVELTKKNLSLEDENVRLREALNLGPAMSTSPQVPSSSETEIQSSSNSSECGSEQHYSVISNSRGSPMMSSQSSLNGTVNIAEIANANSVRQPCGYVDVVAQRQVQAHEAMQLALMRMRKSQQQHQEQCPPELQQHLLMMGRRISTSSNTSSNGCDSPRAYFDNIQYNPSFRIMPGYNHPQQSSGRSS